MREIGRIQVRRTPEWQAAVTGHKWQVVTRINGWPAHMPTRTKAEAEQVKANLKDGLDPFAGIGSSGTRDFEAWELELAQ